MCTRSLPALLLAIPFLTHGQTTPDSLALQQMRADVKYLASDDLEGREAGTPGERLAVNYIAARFEKLGLAAKGDSGYVQAFTFQAEPRLGDGNTLQLGRTKLKQGEQWFPLAYSASGSVRGKVLKLGYGILAPELRTMDYADSADLKDRVVAFSISSPDGIHPHSKYLAYHDLRARAEKAAAHGAAAVVFYNDDPTAEAPALRLSAKASPLPIPVIFLTGDLHEQLVIDNNPCALVTDIIRPTRTAYNAVGMIDNGAANVVVIGAHLDHLGYGDEGSLHTGEPAIHNGADDNASGVAVLMQLAQDLSTSSTRSNDYLFIAFSGEEKGLYGSNYWTKHPTVPIRELNYMINMDMVGRLDSARHLAVYGTGTSPIWDSLLVALRRPIKPKDRRAPLPVDTFNIKMNPEGIGPSDHTSFYLQDVPVLHFFTGQHADYHKPSDDEEKINYDGMLRVTRFIERVITAVDGRPRLTFTRTADADTASAPRFTVTLGVIPDYMFSGKGMAIDGVHDGKPASKAGLKKGDIVIKLGNMDVSDMNSYMKALAALKKGDRTTVKVLREGKEMETDISF